LIHIFGAALRFLNSIREDMSNPMSFDTHPADKCPCFRRAA
jgi:hypothetical protein